MLVAVIMYFNMKKVNKRIKEKKKISPVAFGKLKV
jgi:hypothetical protein